MNHVLTAIALLPFATMAVISLVVAGRDVKRGKYREPVRIVRADETPMFSAEELERLRRRAAVRRESALTSRRLA